MRIIKCFDIVSMVAEENSRRLGSTFRLNRENYSILENYCSRFDEIAEEFDGDSFEAEIDEIGIGVYITFVCDHISIKGTEHYLYELFKRSDGVDFFTIENKIGIKFSFPNLWEIRREEG